MQRSRKQQYVGACAQPANSYTPNKRKVEGIGLKTENNYKTSHPTIQSIVESAI